MEIRRLTTRNGTAETVLQYQIMLRRVRGQVYTYFRCSADQEQDWLPYPVDPLYLLYVMAIQQAVSNREMIIICSSLVLARYTSQILLLSGNMPYS